LCSEYGPTKIGTIPSRLCGPSDLTSDHGEGEN
jgi:hypothetical protein